MAYNLYDYIDAVSVVEEGRVDVGELTLTDKPLGQDIPTHYLEALFAGFVAYRLYCKVFGHAK